MCIKDELKLSIAPYLRYFSFERQQHIQKYRKAADRSRTVWAELLVRYLTCKEVPASWENITVEREFKGKPYIKTLKDRREISLSHSGIWVLCSHGRCKSGVDVETNTEDFEEISRFCFSDKEISFLNSVPLPIRKKLFLCYWTIKESYLKYTGEGLTKNLSEIDCISILKGNQPVAGKNFLLPDGTIAGICTQRNYLPTHINFVSCDEIKKFLLLQMLDSL